MNGHTVPVSPLEPAAVHAAVHLEVLHRAVAGIPLEMSDKDVLAWLAQCERETVATVASLIVRARRAGGTP
jgi:hypothetical protein